MKIFLGIFLILLLYKNAHAYIDPGTGSYIFQLALGLFFGLILAWRWVLKALVSAAKFLLRQARKQNENLIFILSERRRNKGSIPRPLGRQSASESSPSQHRAACRKEPLFVRIGLRKDIVQREDDASGHAE